MITDERVNMTELPEDAKLQKFCEDFNLSGWQKRWMEFLLEAKRTDSKIVIAQGRKGPFWTLKRNTPDR